MSQFSISSLHVHPVKSLQANQVNEAYVGDKGFEFDRRFVLVDETGRFITQRKHPVLTKLSSRYDGKVLKVSGEGIDDLAFSLEEFSDSANVTVWSDDIEAVLICDQRTEQISELLGLKVSMAFMPDKSFRQVDREFISSDQAVSFADAFPFLLANEASLQDLNDKLSTPVTMRRFRPNIVFKGDKAFQEDEWKKVRIGEVEFAVVKPCSRCVMTCIDEQGVRHKEPLNTLATYRKNEFGVCFGQNLVQLNQGKISVGDTLVVIE